MPLSLPRLSPAFIETSHLVLSHSLNLAKGFFLYHVISEYVYDIRPTAGPSMLPTISTVGDSVLISKYHRRGRGIAVGDMVSVRHPVMPEEGAIKRVLGLPGDFVGRDTPWGVWEVGAGEGMGRGENGGEEQGVGDEEDEREEGTGEGMGDGVGEEHREMDRVSRWGRRRQMMIQVPEGHCWIIGDNLAASRDSRFYGPLPLAMIKGKVVARVWPLSKMGWFENTLKRPEDEVWDDV